MRCGRWDQGRKKHVSSGMKIDQRRLPTETLGVEITTGKPPPPAVEVASDRPRMNSSVHRRAPSRCLVDFHVPPFDPIHQGGSAVLHHNERVHTEIPTGLWSRLSPHQRPTYRMGEGQYVTRAPSPWTGEGGGGKYAAIGTEIGETRGRARGETEHSGSRAWWQGIGGGSERR